MSKMTSKLFTTTAVLVTVASFAAPASAGGFLGGIIESACGNCGAGRALDRAHADMGRPLDHAAAAAARARGVPLSPYCATPYGVRLGAFQPVGIPCNVNGAIGVVVQ